MYAVSKTLFQDARRDTSTSGSLRLFIWEKLIPRCPRNVFFKLDLIFKENGDQFRLGIPFFIFIFFRGGGGESMQKELLRTGEVTGTATFRKNTGITNATPLTKQIPKLTRMKKIYVSFSVYFNFFFNVPYSPSPILFFLYPDPSLQRILAIYRMMTKCIIIFWSIIIT